MSAGEAFDARPACRRAYQPPKLRSCIQRQTPSNLRLMTEEDSKSNRHSVWSQFHSPILENATVVDFEQMNPQDKARQVEIRKVRQSIEEMSVLLAEMQEMYHMPLQQESQDDTSSCSEAYVTALDINSPTSSRNAIHRQVPRKTSQAFTAMEDKSLGSESDATTAMERVEGPQRKLRIDTATNRESLRASFANSAATPNMSELSSPKRHDRASPQRHSVYSHVPERSPHRNATDGGPSSYNGSASNYSGRATRHDEKHPNQHQRSLSQPNEVFSVSKHDLPKDTRHHHHPKGHALSHAQHTCKHPKNGADKPAGAHKSRRNSRKLLNEEVIQEKLDQSNDLSIDNLDLPDSERKLLERFIAALSKLSVEVQMDEAKRKEGRRRMNNALRALEGWI